LSSDWFGRRLKRVKCNRTLLLTAITGVGWLAACSIGELPFREDYAKLRAIKVGMTEKEVRDRLGAPLETHQKGTPPEKFCVSGRWCDKTPIGNRLLIYILSEPIAYVYIGADDRVEHVSVGGS
jgi:hypothetical protein